MIVVPDASVLLKWVLQRDDEADSPAALHLLNVYIEDRIEIHLPTLWRYEAGNVLGRKVPRLASECIRTLLAYDFVEHSLESDYCLETLRFMRGLPAVSFYDASYHVLAIRLHGTFVTADQQYLSHARRRGRVISLLHWPAVAPSV